MPAPRILSGDSSPSPQGGSFISKVPTWVWYGIGVVVAIVIFMRLRGGATGTTQSGSPIAAGADSSMLGGPAPPSTLGIVSPSGASINLGNITLTPADVAQIIKDLWPGPATSGNGLPTDGGSTPNPTLPQSPLNPWRNTPRPVAVSTSPIPPDWRRRLQPVNPSG